MNKGQKPSEEAFARFELRRREQIKRTALAVALGRELAEYRRALLLASGKIPEVLVIHPRFGETVVRGESNCDAIHQAAKVWGCEFMDIHEAKVERLEDTYVGKGGGYPSKPSEN